MMQTPIADFVRNYAESSTVRLHMPGHKGTGLMGCESWDITEIKGADALYEADGIIAQSERNAGSLFGSGSTLYSTEGSSQCIRAMLYLAFTCQQGHSRTVVAARNVHKAFVYAAALLDLDVVWLYPQESCDLCACPVTAEALAQTLQAMEEPPIAVYVTSPDYLGNLQDIAALSKVCHRYGTILAVDNAHGAYLHFLPEPVHPLDLGADICCDSAHKTLPALTGAAYLHISRSAPEAFHRCAKQAMALFGSTSPSYLTLVSLDLCNRYIASGYNEALRVCIHALDQVRNQLRENGWQVAKSDPLRLTIAAPQGLSGDDLAQKLRENGIECEFSDPEYLVLMATPNNASVDLCKLIPFLGYNSSTYAPNHTKSPVRRDAVMSVRQAVFSPHETVPAAQSLGRICSAPTVSCPPAIPVVISGEMIDQQAIELFHRYGVIYVDVII